MNTTIGLDHCLSFINCQLQPSRRPLGTYPDGSRRPAITISRQTGSGGHAVAEELAELLRNRAAEDPCPWTVFDRNLVEKVLEEHHLPGRLARFMTEDKISEMADTMDELFGLHPPSWTLVRKTADTILHLAEVGHVIIIGRGANVVTRKMGQVFHLRLVASLESRVRRMQELEKLSAAAARARVLQEDAGRKRFLRKYFNQDIDDSLLYHLVINTDLVSYAEAAHVIADAVCRRTAEGRIPEREAAAA